MATLEQFAIVERFLSREEGSNRSLSDYEKSILTVCQGSGESEEDPEDENEDEQTGDTNNSPNNKPTDKFGGIRLYARFHSFYENQTKDTGSLEDVHLKILEKLNEFSQVYMRS